MSTKKTYEEQLEDLEKKLKEIKQEKKKLQAEHAQNERKKRTKHLIEIGGVVYKVLNREFVDGDVERLVKFLSDQERRGEYLSRAMNNFPPAPTPVPDSAAAPAQATNVPIDIEQKAGTENK